ncbi:uncharacterized protein B0H18DRAFT_624594 [Fomitopsis serialis]|uniref:uncharacterized protein n=1 Tax=Fomitopsis serialis TaxID=139415 RepID=UPI0020080925|nr:uncharacterized protein B0H18DRAFT_624594 [Neoantrodia serialis]KAH9919672.1 hypothetical protein B0H18DRAFT_624594 [Neoantrodia serialis]
MLGGGGILQLEGGSASSPESNSYGLSGLVTSVTSLAREGCGLGEGDKMRYRRVWWTRSRRPSLHHDVGIRTSHWSGPPCIDHVIQWRLSSATPWIWPMPDRRFPVVSTIGCPWPIWQAGRLLAVHVQLAPLLSGRLSTSIITAGGVSSGSRRMGSRRMGREGGVGSGDGVCVCGSSNLRIVPVHGLSDLGRLPCPGLKLAWLKGATEHWAFTLAGLLSKFQMGVDACLSAMLQSITVKRDTQT